MQNNQVPLRLMLQSPPKVRVLLIVSPHQYGEVVFSPFTVTPWSSFNGPQDRGKATMVSLVLALSQGEHLFAPVLG